MADTALSVRSTATRAMHSRADGTGDRVHEYNTAFLLFTFLPYHESSLFPNLLSILPDTIPSTFKFLGPYLKSLTAPPRHAIVYSATTNDGFFTALNDHVLRLCQNDCQHQQLLPFWAAVSVEAVSGRLELARSGRQEIQRQREEDVLIKILPVLNDGLSLGTSVELTVACYTISIVLATKATLANNVLNRLMEAVTGSFNSRTSTAGMICLAIIAGRQKDPFLPRKVASTVQKLPRVDQLLLEMKAHYDTAPLIQGIVATCMSTLGGKNTESKIQFVQLLLQSNCVPEEALPKVVNAILRTAETMASETSNKSTYRPLLRKLVKLLGHEAQLSGALSKVLAESKIDIDRLEANLQMTLDTSGQILLPQNAIVEDDEDPTVEKAFTTASGNVPEQAPAGTSFLSAGESPLFNQIHNLLHIAIDHKSSIEKFQKLTLLQKQAALEDPLYLSFFCRVLAQDRLDAARVVAIESIALVVIPNIDSIDTRAIFPYIMIALADSVAKVRKAASHIIMAMSSLSSSSAEGSSDSRHLSAKAMYCITEQVEQGLSLSLHDFSRILRKIFLPILEECNLDPGQLKKALESALKGTYNTTQVNARLESIDIKKSLRISFFKFLIDHVLWVPLYSVKLKVLELLASVHRVGSRIKSDELSPFLQIWATKPAMNVQSLAQAEKLEADQLEYQIPRIISPGDRQPVTKILSLFKQESPLRDTFFNAMYSQLVEMWPLLKHDSKVSASQVLFEEAFSPDRENESIPRFCRDILRAVSIPSESLTALLDRVSNLVTEQSEELQPLKKRRLNHGQYSLDRQEQPEKVLAYISEMTFVLEVVDGSEPEQRPDVLRSLFKALGAVHHLRTRLEAGMDYVLTLALGSILAIVRHAGSSSTLQLDPSAIRIDHAINCVRVSKNQQVQNTALLVIANIARLAPDVVLHSVMPIFTFIGSSTSQKDDEYSAHVIDQTVDFIIPPLIRSLKDQKRDVLAGGSELLSHFTAAFEHIPSHRRARLFETLISKLGHTDFLFAALAMLAIRDVEKTDKHNFVTTLATRFPLDVQLISHQKFLALISDALAQEPKDAQTVLNVSQLDSQDRHKTILAMVQSLPFLFTQRGLGNLMDKSLRNDSTIALNTREAFTTTLERLLLLGASVQNDSDLSEGVTTAINSLLEIPSLPELISVATNLLSHDDDKLRLKVLRLIENRLANESGKAVAIQSSAVRFLQELIRVLESSLDTLLRVAAVACIDRISENFGRKNVESILPCAHVLASPKCLGDPDRQLVIMSLLCLSTMVETCKQGMIPVLPEALPRAFEQISCNINEDDESTRLYNAGLSMVLSIVSNLPWMVSEDDIVSIISLSSESVGLSAGKESQEVRKEVFRVLAEKVDLHDIVEAIRRSWPTVTSNGVEALSDSTLFLSNGIERHTKSAISRNSDLLLDFFTLALDLRRFHLSDKTEDSYSEAEIDGFEVEIHPVFLKMIYKLNDSSFRPLFLRLVDWSTKAPDLAQSTSAEKKQLHRQTSLFKLLAYFFTTLKSLVTPYTGFVLQPAVEILESIVTLSSAEGSRAATSADSHTLWLSTLSMLRPALDHDQDAYFSTPSHYTSLSAALVSQLKLAATPPFTHAITTAVIPPIVSLARATVSTPAHHQSLNSAICALRHDDRPAVRLASVRCQAALTEALAEEWLENVSGEMMVYVNEMLEDDDDEVDREVRRWVGRVQEVLGEEIGV